MTGRRGLFWVGAVCAAALGVPLAAADLFRGESADPVMSAAIASCLTKRDPAALEACRFTVSDACFLSDGIDADLCFLREAATWDQAMQNALPGALSRVQEADDYERSQNRPAQSEAMLRETQRLFDSYRAQTCTAEAAPYGPYGEATRTYALCLIRLTSDQAFRLLLWGEI